MDFMREFPDDKTCLEHLWRTRFAPDGETADCPKCRKARTFKRYETAQKRPSWTCTGCGHHLHVLAGTIFEKSSTSLHLWFYAMYLMTSTRCGISAKQLERELGVTYKTAWRMAHLIRHKLMAQEDSEPLEGSVEIDEAYVGGRRRLNRGGSLGRPGPTSHLTPVLGMVERKGRVFVTTVPSVKRATLFQHIEERVLPASTIYTDELEAYRTIQGSGYQHRRINHSEKVYVSGDIHTNTIEGFWSLTKNGIRGVYHAVSRKHLQGYLNEYAWRYNERHSPRAKFSTLLRRASLL
ncbi:MAG TPA: IS1595 family transposase [Vicinamibacterales bacterium]|nr:IS1595 family transposase [Vicinamibacterales bacterium]